MTSFWPSVRRVAEYVQAWDEYQAETCKSATESRWGLVEQLWDGLSDDEREAVPERCRPVEARVSFTPLPLPKGYSPVHERTITIRLNDEEEGA